MSATNCVETMFASSLPFVGCSCFIYVISIYFGILVSNPISISYDVRVVNINTMGATSGAGTAYHFEFMLGFSGVRVAQYLFSVYCFVDSHCLSLFFILLAIVLFVIILYSSGYCIVCPSSIYLRLW